jgi:hypothetical protein
MVMITMIGLVVLGTALIVNREKLNRSEKMSSYTAESRSQAGKEAPIGRDCVRLLDIGFYIRLIAAARAAPHPDPSAEEFEKNYAAALDFEGLALPTGGDAALYQGIRSQLTSEFERSCFEIGRQLLVARTVGLVALKKPGSAAGPETIRRLRGSLFKLKELAMQLDLLSSPYLTVDRLNAPAWCVERGDKECYENSCDYLWVAMRELIHQKYGEPREEALAKARTKAVLQASLEGYEKSIMAHLPKDVTPEEKERLHQAFADVSQGLKDERIKEEDISPAQSKLREIDLKGSSVSRQHILELTRALEEAMSHSEGRGQ